SGSFVSLRDRLVDAFRALNGSHLSFQRRADVAWAAEKFVERRVLAYIAELVDHVDVLVLCGGLALNCSINAHVAALCRSRRVTLVIPPPAGDAGVALGAAVAGCGRPSAAVPVAEPYLERGFSPDDIARELHEHGATVEALDAPQLASELVK